MRSLLVTILAGKSGVCHTQKFRQVLKKKCIIYGKFFVLFSYWKGKLPRQGWMYLTVNYLCFHAYILGLDTKLLIRWSEITQLNKTNSVIFPDSIMIGTREKEYHFSMFLRKNETFSLMEQLADLAAKR